VLVRALEDERGTTMVELLVGMAMGMVVLVGLTMTIIVVLHGTARVDARVESTDNVRVAVARVMEELHSACVSPQIAPVQEKSTGNSLVFWHAAAGEATAVEPIPVKSKIAYSGGTLTQTDYAKTGGTSPNWVFSETGSERKLLTNVAPATGSSVVFSYYKYESGALVKLTATELSKTEAEAVIVVKVALTASPKSTPVHDAGAAATVEDSATLRLTPPSFNEGASALPCQ
jgi:Tfp pilus assembly protein PilW